MEIILLEDVKKLGKKGGIVSVNDGYARNYIIPKKLGVEATKKAKNDLNLQKQAEDRKEKELLDEANQLLKKIENTIINVSLKTGEGGRIFGSISTKEIANKLNEQIGFKIDKKKIHLDEPIKSIGTHIVTIKIHHKVNAKLKVKVSSK